MKKITVAIAVAALLFGGAFTASAQTAAPSAAAQALLQQIQQLQSQIQQLQAQLRELRGETKAAVAELVAELKEGSSGETVAVLQAILAADPGVYPEGLITGFFGRLTRNAVVRFQAQQGLPQVGIVGPQTRGALNRLLKANPIALENGTSTHGRPCAIVPPGHLIAPGWLRKHDGVAPIVPPCQTLPPGILARLNATSTPPDDNGDDDTDPVISGVTSTVATSSAVVSWMTDEPATSQVRFGTSTDDLDEDTALDNSLVLSHSQTLTGLTPDTTYFFEVRSRDAAGNLAVSAEESFMTDEE